MLQSPQTTEHEGMCHPVVVEWALIENTEWALSCMGCRLLESVITSHPSACPADALLLTHEFLQI
jgi:hypothetical protein